MMMILSVMFLIAYTAISIDPNLPLWGVRLVIWVFVVTWLVYLVEYVILAFTTKLGWKFPLHYWLLTLSLIFPVFRPFILLTYLPRVHPFKVGDGPAVRYRIVLNMSAYAVLFVYVTALSVLRAERGAPGANIENFGDAIWWAVVTIATVGYGDTYPVTVWGRVFATVLMAGGVAIIGTATATMVSYLGDIVTSVENSGGGSAPAAQANPLAATPDPLDPTEEAASPKPEQGPPPKHAEQPHSQTPSNAASGPAPG